MQVVMRNLSSWDLGGLLSLFFSCSSCGPTIFIDKDDCLSVIELSLIETLTSEDGWGFRGSFSCISGKGPLGNAPFCCWSEAPRTMAASGTNTHTQTKHEVSYLATDYVWLGFCSSSSVLLSHVYSLGINSAASTTMIGSTSHFKRDIFKSYLCYVNIIL